MCWMRFNRSSLLSLSMPSAGFIDPHAPTHNMSSLSSTNVSIKTVGLIPRNGDVAKDKLELNLAISAMPTTDKRSPIDLGSLSFAKQRLKPGHRSIFPEIRDRMLFPTPIHAYVNGGPPTASALFPRLAHRSLNSTGGHDLARKTNLSPYGTIGIHRILLRLCIFRLHSTVTHGRYIAPSRGAREYNE